MPIFGDQGNIGFTHPVQLIYYGLLGVICGIGGLLYERSFYGFTKMFHRLVWPRWLKPAVQGFWLACSDFCCRGRCTPATAGCS